MTKVLVLGAGGMAGHVVSLYLKEEGFDVTTLSAHTAFDDKTIQLDVADTQVFNDFLDANTYDIIVNCIALLVKQSDDRKDLAVYLNSYLPHLLEYRYRDSNTRIVQLSSDGVFSGKASPYKEDSFCDGESFYGRTKALGELVNDKDLTLRLSIIGPDMRPQGQGLFHWFRAQTGELSGYTNVIWNGITTIELAKAIKEAINQNITGLYHLAPTEGISKFNLLQLFRDVFDQKDVTINPAEGTAWNSVLLNSRRDFQYEIPDYKTMITNMKEWIERHSDLYKHYDK